MEVDVSCSNEITKDNIITQDSVKNYNNENEKTKTESSGLEVDLTEVKDNATKDTSERMQLRKSILEHLLANDGVAFKNFPGNEEKLTNIQKEEMVAELLDNNFGVFLVKFGKYLKVEHLDYFEARSEEDSLIVDLQLKQLNKLFEQNLKRNQLKRDDGASASEEAMEVSAPVEASPAEKTRLELRTRLLDHLSLSTDAHFRSQQVGEPDLAREEKRDIAEQLLNRSFSLFLAKYGNHLLEEHLDFFNSKDCEENYEVNYHLKRLRKNHCKAVTKVGIKNRRFEALKKMIDEGSYFSETEMRNRNPLLYEELVGKFLTPEERRERIDNVDTTNITLVNLLLEKMDREAVKKLKKDQEDEEDDEMEEENNFDEQMESEIDSEEDNELDKTMWGENYAESTPSVSSKATKHQKKDKKECKIQVKQTDDIPEVEESEKYLLMQEFRSNMFSNFLQGNDVDFDYSKVDYNSDYDDLEAEGNDEEEKYFDEDSSEKMSSQNNDKMSDTEDVLDEFMSQLQSAPTTQQLADRLQDLTHKDT